MKLSSLIKLSSIASILLSNAVFAENYQSFSSLGYSKSSASYTEPVTYTLESSYFGKESFTIYNSKRDSDSLSLFTQYYFEEQQTLGPLNEFNYINTSSNISALVNNNSTESFQSASDRDSSWDTSGNEINVAGQWITHDFLIGAGYSYIKSNHSYLRGSFDDSSYSASLGYFISDDLVIRADYFAAEDDEYFFTDDGDYFSYSASYNLQLSGTDYIGFSYNVDENFDIHHLSSKYFLALTQESYLVLAGDYTIDNSDNFFADDSWNINSRYYFDTQTSVSVFYGKNDAYGESDTYGIAASYFINNNYSVQAGYNSNFNDNDKYEVDRDGYSLSFAAQF